jgi:hypothetical protein
LVFVLTKIESSINDDPFYPLEFCPHCEQHAMQTDISIN